MYSTKRINYNQIKKQNPNGHLSPLYKSRWQHTKEDLKLSKEDRLLAALKTDPGWNAIH